MKMKRISKLVFIAFFGAVLFNACSSDDNNDPIGPEPAPDPEAQAYEHGFFVTNEGQFPNEGTISFISDDFEAVEQLVYQNVNDGEDVGSVVQSMFFDEENAYVIANNSNFVTVVDRYTFEKKTRIETDFTSPRYGVSLNGKGYVTNLAAPNLTVIDLDDSTTSTVEVGRTSEYIFAGEDGLIYLQQAAFGTGNTIAVFDPATAEVITTLETEAGLNSMALSTDHLYALTSTTLERFSLTDYQLQDVVELNYEMGVANLVYDQGNLYFTSGNEVYEMAPNAAEAPDTPLFTYETDSDWGVFYGFTVKDGKVYVADGGDFASESFIEVWDVNGNKLTHQSVGIGPNGFYFND